MPSEAAFFLGLFLGVGGLLLIQAFTRSKVRQALAAANPAITQNLSLRREDDEQHRLEIETLRQRLTVLERITIDPAVRTAREIEALR